MSGLPMIILYRAVLMQQLFKLGLSRSSLFTGMKATMPTASEALPGNCYCLLALFFYTMYSTYFIQIYLITVLSCVD